MTNYQIHDPAKTFPDHLTYGILDSRSYTLLRQSLSGLMTNVLHASDPNKQNLLSSENITFFQSIASFRIFLPFKTSLRILRVKSGFFASVQVIKLFSRKLLLTVSTLILF